jgi:MoxR-like ATPase
LEELQKPSGRKDRQSKEKGQGRLRGQSQSLVSKFLDEISQIVVGREIVVKLMLTALLSEGHILIEGNPGLGKTTLAKAFARTIGGEFKRIQMTPDTLPADILGTLVYADGRFTLHKGPIFGNVILVDELNRATPKAQAALLESMQERQVSFEGETTKLNDPFIVLATQVAFGTAGTYPLSEVQSDRFAFSVQVDNLARDEEFAMLSRINEIHTLSCSQILSPDEILVSTEKAREVFVSDRAKEYIIELRDFVLGSGNVKSAPSPRSSIALLKGARALAFLDGRNFVTPDHVKFLAPYAFRHRIFLTPEAIADEVTPTQILSEMLEAVRVPRT